MKKSIFSLLIIVILFTGYTGNVMADKIYTVTSKTVNVNVTARSNNEVYFSSIKNKKTNTDIILKNPSKKANIWTVKAKKSNEFMSPEIALSGKDAAKFKAVPLKNKLTLTWTNVKTSDMTSGFDVVVTANVEGDATYWDISVTPIGEDYAVWQVVFPEIVFNFEDGQEFFSGIYGGFLENTNPYKSPDGLSRVTCQYPSNMPFQMCYVTQNRSGIYLCPEDTEGFHKIYYWPSLNDNEIDYYLTLMPNDQGVGGVAYKQAYKFNISSFDGDWYDSLKRYRKWAIDNKMPAFKNGPLATREDIPKWLKENCFWGNDYQRSLVGSVPTAFHLYTWWHLPHDVGYPEMLPAKEDTVASWMKRKNGNYPFKLVYYTNPHLIDSKNSPLYQQYGNEMVSLMANFQPRPFDWAKDKTVNYGMCPSLDIVQDTIVNLQKTLVTKYDADGVYLDEISTISPDDCYNKNHGHPLGTGNRWVSSYNKLMERIMKECSEAKGEPIAIFSEGTAEPFVTVACLDLSVHPYAPFAISALYSGYRIQWGQQYNAGDFTPSEMPGIAKMAYSLMGGWQLGWYEYLPAGKDYKDFPDFTLYQKNACLARYKAVDYMNLGEMVRPVTVENIPNVDVQMALNVTEKTPYYSVPAVQTSSWNYNGKTALVFTNITKDTHHIAFSVKAQDLNLPEKEFYTIKQIFPTEKEINLGELKGEFDINSLETVVLIAE